jgi:hypothetical protein
MTDQLIKVARPAILNYAVKPNTMAGTFEIILEA